jgi:hypothetical protein
MSVSRASRRSSSSCLSPKSPAARRRCKKNFTKHQGLLQTTTGAVDSPARVPTFTTLPCSFNDFAQESSILFVPLTFSPRTVTDCLSVCKSIPEHEMKNLSIPPKNRTVHFALESEVHYVDYPCDEAITERWYQRADYLSFKQDTRATIIAIYRAEGQLHRLDMNQYTVSGLEKALSLKQVLARKRKTALHVRTVLCQQKHCNNPIQIRQISEFFTKPSMRRAHFRGILDRDLLFALYR